MAGNDRRGIVIQLRDERLFREVAVMRFIDREQAKIVAGFGSTTRANARLLALVNAGLLRRFFQGTTAGGKKALYTLSQKGARLVGVSFKGFRHRNDELLVTNFFVAHQHAVNEIYCMAKFRPIIPEAKFVCWMSFSEPICREISLIPDGYFEVFSPQGIVSAFLEVDLGSEGSPVWKEKVQNTLRYAASGNFEERFGQPRFRVLVVANTERRMQAIRRVVRSFTDKIFWFSTSQAIQQNGLWASIWLRPVEDIVRSFF